MVDERRLAINIAVESFKQDMLLGELAEKAKVTGHTIYEIGLKDGKPLTVQSLAKISDALGIPCSKLIEASEVQT